MNYFVIAFAICLLGDPLTCVGTVQARKVLPAPDPKTQYTMCMTVAFVMARKFDVHLRPLGLEAFPVHNMTCRLILGA